MKVTYLKSATIIVEHNGKRILCDPWFTDGVYYGSWYHFPPIEFDARHPEIANIDGIYISHIHPDHFSIKDLDYFPRDIPIYIHRFQERFLRRRIKQLGFTNVIELVNGKSVSVGKDFDLTIFAADDCNPEVCGKFFGCQWMGNYTGSMQIDTLAVFHSPNKNQVIVNTNDCQYDVARGVLDKIRNRYKHIDLLLSGYSSASPFPQCYKKLDVMEKFKAKDKLIEKFYGKACCYIEHLKPKYMIPFAGQYCLGGRWSEYNRFLAQPDYPGVPSALERTLLLRVKNKQVIKIPTKIFGCNPFDTFDLDKPEIPPPPKHFHLSRYDYAMEYLKDKPFSYPENPDPMPEASEWLAMFEEAQRFMKVRKKFFSHVNAEKWTLFLRFGEHLAKVPFGEGKPTFVETITKHHKPYIEIELSPGLLYEIMHRRCHWNNAEVGSHLKFYRDPDEYERSVFFFLCFFHMPKED